MKEKFEMSYFLAVKELEIKTLKERIAWLETLNADYLQSIRNLQASVNNLNAYIQSLSKEEHHIGFNHDKS